MTVVSHDELQRWGGVTLAEVMSRVPGLNLSSAYFTDRSIVTARGDQTKINGGHVLFLINGRPTREVLEGGLVSDLLESFPVTSLDHIEVIKGPGSVLYGSNAFSAVINLITLKDKANGFSASARPGPDGTMATAGEGTYSCGAFNIVASGQMHKKPTWSTSYSSAFTAAGDPASSFTSQNVNIEDKSHGAYVGANYRGLSVMTSYTDWRNASFVRGAVGAPQWKRGFADVGYEFKPTTRWTSTVNYTYTRNTFDIEEYPFIKRDSSENLLEWTNIIYPTDRDQVTVGALFNHVQGGETFYGLGFPLPISNGDRNGSGAYAQVDHLIVTGLKGVVGIQANRIGTLGNVVPRGGLIWLPSANLTVKGLYGEAFRAPSINELTLNHPQLSGTPDLRPEMVGTFDVEVAYQKDRVQGSVNFFRSRHTDSITVDTTPARWRYANLGTATFRGGEFEGKYYVTRSIMAIGSVFHQSNENGDGQVDITPIPDTTAKMGVSWEGNEGLTFGIFDTYMTAVTNYTNTVNPPSGSSHLLSGQVRFDVSKYFHRMNSTGLTFVMNANNLTNHQLWLPDLGGGTGDTIPSSGGRVLYVGAEVSFNRTARSVPQTARRD
jgi:outer membrane receptor protein involved in Fe transport